MFKEFPKGTLSKLYMTIYSLKYFWERGFEQNKKQKINEISYMEESVIWKRIWSMESYQTTFRFNK